MKNRSMLLGGLLALGACAPVPPPCVSYAKPGPAASGDAPPAEVRRSDAAPKKAAPNGKGHIWLLAQGQNAFVGKLELAPFATVPEHRDPTEEYIHVLAGQGVLTMDGVKHEVGPGTTIFMPAHATVSYENGGETFVGIQVFAGPGPAAKYDAWQ